MKALISFLAITLLMLGLGCGGGEQETETATEEPVAEETAPVEEPQPPAEIVSTTAIGEIPAYEGDTVTTASGLRYIDLKVGDGAALQVGQTVSVHYTGWTASDGKKFDSSHDRGQPMQFPVGTGRMIPGFDEGVMSMNIGGKRLLILPGDLAYGPRGNPRAGIGPNATLLFDVEVVSAQ